MTENKRYKAREEGTGKWVFGTLNKLEYNNPLIDNDHIYTYTFIEEPNTKNACTKDVDLDTVCMYTGKLDIYENDLIKVGGDLGQVFADTELEVWGIEFTDGTAVCLDEFDEASLKVVGNIFDD